jgi:hypothetical protein
MGYPSDKQIMEVGAAVAEMAYSLFLDLGIKDDFCVQSGIVFGGWNRIIWTPMNGFVLDEPYCTPHVIERWKAMKK